MCEPNGLQMTSGLLSDVTGRDKIMRTCSFTAGFLATLANEPNAQKFRAIQGQISSCRVVFRLFGDLPSWLRARRSNWGRSAVIVEPKTNKNPLTETVSMLNVAADLVYAPVEHIAWAAQNGIIPTSAGKWWTGAIAVWVVSLSLAIFRSMSNLSALRRKLASLRNKQNCREEYQNVQRQIITEQMNVVRCSSDLMCAINSLPKGFLWSQRLSPRLHCLFGMISSITGLLQVKRDLYPHIRE